VRTDFERLRPRRPVPDQPRILSLVEGKHDVEGKRALFSTVEEKPARGSVTVECSGCQEVSVLSPGQAGRLLLTSVHAPGLRRRHVSWMRCPSCGRRAWCRLKLRL